MEYTASDEWPEVWSTFVVEGLAGFNAAHSVKSTERKLSVIANDAHGTVVGGLLGRTDHGWLHVGWLWVSDDHRGQGIGTELMDRAEAMAREWGCHHAHLTTLDFQASRFYERRGYRVFGILEDYPKPFRRMFMRKDLNPAEDKIDATPPTGDA